MRSAGGTWLPWGAWALAYAAMTAWYTWPLVHVGADHVVMLDALLVADAYYFLWILTWVARALGSDWTVVLHGDVGYPAPWVATGAETLIGVQPVFAPVWATTGNPVLGLNAVLFASFVAGALAMHCLVRRWTGSSVAAVGAAVAFAFAPWRLDLGRLYLLQMQYLPLVLLLADQAIVRGSVARGVATGLVLGLQILASFWAGYMAVVSVALYAVVHLLGSHGRWSGATWRAALCIPGATLLAILPVAVAYLGSAARGALPANPSSAELVALSAIVGSPVGLMGAYAGWGATMVGGVGALVCPRASSWLGRVRIAAVALCVLMGLAIAAGPGGMLGGWIDPYRWLASVFPGFDRLRAPRRFGALVGFGFSVLAGFALARLASGARRGGWRAGIAGVVTMGALATIAWPLAFPLPLVAIAVPTQTSVPEVYRWLAARGDGGTVLELPIGDQAGITRDLAAARAMYLSTFHGHPLVNVYAGFPVPSYALTEHWAQQLPSVDALDALVRCAGLRWIVVHRGAPRVGMLASVPGLRLAQRFPSDTPQDDVLLYEVTRTADTSCRERLAHAVATPPATMPGPAHGRLAVTGLPAAIRVRSDQRITVAAENEEDAPWDATAVAPGTRVEVLARWIDTARDVEIQRERVMLPRDVPAHGVVLFEAWLTAPRVPGDHRLELGLVRGHESAAIVASPVRVW